MNKLVELIDEKVIPGPRPAVYLSGGIDSSIVLYHLKQKTREPIISYTANFGTNGECERAARVAGYFGVQHRIVRVEGFVARLTEILAHFDRPHYNVWGYWLAEAARSDSCLTAYLGEGGDENFGYSDRSFLVGWANHICYVEPTYVYIHKAFDLELRMPLHDLPWRYFLENCWSPGKEIVREAYKGLLPDFVRMQPSSPPAFVDYMVLWERELQTAFPGYKPRNGDDVKYALQILVARIWAKLHEGKLR